MQVFIFSQKLQAKRKNRICFFAKLKKALFFGFSKNCKIKEKCWRFFSKRKNSKGVDFWIFKKKQNKRKHEIRFLKKRQKVALFQIA